MPLSPFSVRTSPAAGLRFKRITIRRLSQRSAFLSLFKNTFNAKTTEPERIKRQFVLVVSKVPQDPFLPQDLEIIAVGSRNSSRRFEKTLNISLLPLALYFLSNSIYYEMAFAAKGR